jgi:Ricin-type beta-trefoil lectin domain
MPSRDDSLPDTPRDDGPRDQPRPDRNEPRPTQLGRDQPHETPALQAPTVETPIVQPLSTQAPSSQTSAAQVPSAQAPAVAVPEDGKPAGGAARSEPAREAGASGTGFRFTRPKHLREDVPELPPAPLDPRRAAARTGSTVPMPVVNVDKPVRRMPGRRTWLAAAAAIVVIAAASFVLSGQRSGTGDAPPLDTRAGEPLLPATTVQPWSAAPSPSATASPTPGRTARASRSLASSPTPSAPAVVAQPLAGATSTKAAATTPPPATTPPAGPVALPIVPHTGTLKIATSGKCLDDWSSNNSDGNPIQVYPCNGTGAQVISFGADGTLRVIGKCIKPASTSSGALVQLRTCDGSTASAWYFRSDKVIVNKASGKCLTDSGALTNNLPQTTIATCTATPSQRWTFT